MRCAKCGPLPDEQFHKTAKDGGYCRACRSAYSKEHYRRNKTTYNTRRGAWRRVYRKRLAEMVLAAKKDRKCADCTDVHPPWAMEFDHRDPATKLFNIADGVGAGVSVAAMRAELEKCDLVCVLCHRYRTHGERRFFGV